MLARAYQLRDFEIDMYWKRAQYFWSFLAVIYAGYFLVISYEGETPLHIAYPLIICLIGCVFSFAWYLVNRGSKRWQNHWEIIINDLEEQLRRPLYNRKVKIEKEVFNAGNFSVSRIIIFVSLFIFCTWIFLAIFTIAKDHISNNHIVCIISSVTFISIILLIFLGRGNTE